MELRHLRTFVAVAEQGTVTKAALRLHIAQPALSRQIKDLERELGVLLFDRIHARLRLTDSGSELLSHCRGILTAVDALSERAQFLQRPDSGVLRVGATAQMIDGVFSSFIHRFARIRPNVRIELIEAVGGDLLAALERGDAHLAISGTRLIQAAGHPFSVFPLPPVGFLAASASLPFGNKRLVEISRLGSSPLLLLDSSFFFRRTFDAACRLAGFQPQILIESRTPHALLSLAEAGHGIAIVASILPTHRYRLQVSRLSHGGKPLQEPFAVLWDKRRALPPFATDFCRELAAHMREAASTNAAIKNPLRAGQKKPRAKAR
jgi:DNA-binding transcriptional LysR family regulator